MWPAVSSGDGDESGPDMVVRDQKAISGEGESEYHFARQNGVFRECNESGGNALKGREPKEFNIMDFHELLDHLHEDQTRAPP